MRGSARLSAVARVRLREAGRGPTAGFLLFYLALAFAAVAAVPGRAGPDRQRAVDTLVLDAAILVTALAAAAFGATSLSSDREAGRESLLRASPLRPHELLLGGLAGHLGALLLLVLGVFAGFLVVTGTGSGGDADRAPTRVPIRARQLLDFRGEPVDHALVLGPKAPAATFVLPAGRSEIERAAAGTGSVRCYFRIKEYVDLYGGIPDEYEVVVRVGDHLHHVTVHRGVTPWFPLAPSEVAPSPDTRIEIRRVEASPTIAVEPDGLLVQGPIVPFVGNVAAAAFGWFLALAVIAAAAAALSTVVGAPVAVAGTLLIVLIGRSLAVLKEASVYLREGGGALPTIGKGLAAAVRIWPDFSAFDFTPLVSARWAATPGEVAARIPPALAGVAAMLFGAWCVLALGRRR